MWKSKYTNVGGIGTGDSEKNEPRLNGNSLSDG